MFKPRWKKDAIHLDKAAKKFLNYKRDLLEADRVAEIQSRRADLRAAIRSKDLDAVKETSKQVRNTCEKSLSQYREPSWLEENVEVFWVAIVIALAIRAFFLQPFRIPTGSMQPSLNGIVATDLSGSEEWDKPWFGKQAFDFVASGRNYYNLVAEKDLTIKRIEDATIGALFTGARLVFDDGSSVRIGCPVGEAIRIPTINQHYEGASGGEYSFGRGPHYKAGEAIFKGYLTSGDLVFVDKMSYHFRQPRRGESFVFDTRGINTTDPQASRQKSKTMQSQQGGTHYIKRLVGLPGDTLQITNPDLYVNGKLAKEETIRRVASRKKDSKGYPYTGYTNPNPRRDPWRSRFADPNYTFEVKENAENNNYNEFFALGDNSSASLDSRYWGTVKQHNLVGPAFVALWPFTSGHWGFIE